MKTYNDIKTKIKLNVNNINFKNHTFLFTKHDKIFKGKLFTYQNAIVQKELKRNSHALFMDMGTGKTIVSLALFTKSRAKNLLVICLSNKVNDWFEDCSQNLLLTKSIILTNSSKKSCELVSKLLINGEISNVSLITNFEMVWRIKNLVNLIDENWFIIIDESHKIKNPSSKVTKFCLKLVELTENKAILTGTPQSNGYIDYFAQLNFLGFFDVPLREFKNEFCEF
jgi:SNF2 family DNA or RNA helicase